MILVTRPDPGLTETAARLTRLGHAPVLAPALLLTPRRFALPRAQAILLTSRAAARALPPPRDIPLLAVGAATAEAAREAGWRDVTAAAGTAAEMADQAARTFDPAGGALLLAVGRNYSLDLAEDLRARGFKVIRRIAYVATPATELPRAALRSLREGHVRTILFHSPRSARCAITLLRAAGLGAACARMEALAISPRVAQAAAEALAPLAFRALRVADRPDEASLLALLGPSRRAAEDPSGVT